MYKSTIGTNAGKVWHALKEAPAIKIDELAQRLNLSLIDTALAIGWLARENNVYVREKEGCLWIDDDQSLMFSFG